MFYHSVEWLVMKSLRRLKMALRLEIQQIMKRKMNVDFHAKFIPAGLVGHTIVVSACDSNFEVNFFDIKKITYCYKDLSPKINSRKDFLHIIIFTYQKYAQIFPILKNIPFLIVNSTISISKCIDIVEFLNTRVLPKQNKTFY